MKAVMKKHSPLLLAAFAILLTIGLVSWGQQQQGGRYEQSGNDTTPKTKKSDRDKKVRDLDEVLDEMERMDFDKEMEKASREIAEAMKELDGNKLKLEIEKAMKDIDMAAIEKEIKTSLAKVDFDKIKAEITESPGRNQQGHERTGSGKNSAGSRIIPLQN